MKRIDILAGLIIILISCGGTDKKHEEIITAPAGIVASGGPVVLPKDPRHLNISILIDLSNRIDPKVDPKQPEQYERDLAIVRHFAAMFKQDVVRHNTFQTDASLKVFFHPEPNDQVISSAARQLVAECRSGNKGEAAVANKRVYQKLDSNIREGMQTIYQKAKQSKNYPGSNIWRFMKDEANLKCVRDTAKFRNILVILTDGYMYYKNELQQQGNRFTYIERNMPHVTRFRKSSDVARDLEKGDYGFLGFNQKLTGLEVLVMEMSPPESSPQDFDIMRAYWHKWLRELGVRRYATFKTDQPAIIPSNLNGYFERN
jgi:hypothetical protein